MTLDLGSSRVVGRRLVDARQARGITQDVAAEYLGLSRPAVTAIEQGERPPQPAEIAKLATLYGRPVHWFARAVWSVPDFPAHFRALVDQAKPAEAEAIQRAIDEFQRSVEDYLDLEWRLNSPIRRNDPPVLTLDPPVDIATLAEDMAGRERRRLGLGDQPIPDIRSLLESEVGLRIFLGSLPGHLAGISLWDDELGGCLLINGDHPAAQRRVAIAREYARLIVVRSATEVDLLSVPDRSSINERFAEVFALSFLIPASPVQRQFHEVVNTSGTFEVADLVRLKRFWHVSLAAMTRRLEGLDLLRAGIWDLLQEQRSPVQEPATRPGPPTEARPESALPERYRFLAVRAFERGDLTEQELAAYLRSDLWDARQQVKNLLQSLEVDADGQAHPLSVDFNTSLLADPV